MFGNARQGAQAYNNIGIETGVFSASPHQLTLMLYDGAKAALNNAIMYMRNRQIADKGRSITHAIRIIGEGLRSSLNKEAGGELAGNLDALYDYMCRRLLQANLDNDEGMILEVIGLIDTIRDAWVQIGDQPAAAQTTQPPVQKNVLQGGYMESQTVHTPAMVKA